VSGPVQVPSYRMGVFFFAVVSVATLAGFILVAVLSGPLTSLPENLKWLALFTLPVPAAGAALGFAFVSRGMGGRRQLAELATFFGTAAATVLLLPSGTMILLLVPLVAGCFALLARRLLDDPPGV